MSNTPRVDVSDSAPNTASGDYSDAVRALDSEAKRALVENHREFLRFLERRLGRRDLAEDILQEAFARGLEKLETLRDGEAAVPWFYRTLRNSIIDYYRRTQSTDRALSQLAAEIETSEEPTEVMRAEACRCVSRLADTLKPEYAQALRRIEVDGIPVTQFAEEQGISKSNAAVRVFRAREALRRQVAVSCGTCAEHGCISCTCGTPDPAAKTRGCGH
jgi:RNA polymerase sigma-70 factor (ECF subfamily)